MKTINLVFLLKVLFVIVPLWVQIRKKITSSASTKAGRNARFVPIWGLWGVLFTISTWLLRDEWNFYNDIVRCFHQFVLRIFSTNFSQFHELKTKSHQIFKINILFTSSHNQISKFRIPNIYNKILFILFSAWSKVGPTVRSGICNTL